MNHYSAIVFFPATEKNAKPMKYRNITNLKHFVEWLKVKYPNAGYINVYEKVSKQYLQRIYMK
jgi:hypothetical protein